MVRLSLKSNCTIPLAVFVLCWMAAPGNASAQPQTLTGTITMESEEGDWVGAGEEYSFASPGTEITGTAITSSGFDGPHTIAISLTRSETDDHFSMDFSTRRLGVVMKAGKYTDAQRAAFADEGHPGLSISGNGRGCNTISGEFTVTEFDWVMEEAECSVCNPKIYITSFSATFEQHCEGGEPALFGTVNLTGSAPNGGGGGDDGGDGETPAPLPPPDVRLIMNEGRVFEIGNSRDINLPIHVTVVEGWNHDVELMAMAPKGIALSFEPSHLPAPGTGETTLAIEVDAMTLPIRHAVPLVIRSGGRTFEDMIFVDVVCDPPIILDQSSFQPTSSEITSGERVTLSVNPTGGTEPYSFQWYEGTSYSTRKPVEGATDSVFTTPPITKETGYWVRVSNACGSRDSWIAVLTPSLGQGVSTPAGRRRGTSRPGGD